MSNSRALLDGKAKLANQINGQITSRMTDLLEDLGTNSKESVDYPDFASSLIENMKKDINSRGILIVEMSNRSPLARFLSVNDIILEVQKTPVSSETIDQFVKNIIKKGEQTLLLTILNKNNQRRYIGVKIN